MTKTYTAAAVLRLMEQGELALDDAVERHLKTTTKDSLLLAGYDVRAITVRQLLLHTLGLPDYSDDGTNRLLPQIRSTTGPVASESCGLSTTLAQQADLVKSLPTATPAMSCWVRSSSRLPACPKPLRTTVPLRRPLTAPHLVREPRAVSDRSSTPRASVFRYHRHNQL